MFFIKTTQRGKYQNSNFKTQKSVKRPQMIFGSIDGHSRTCCMSNAFTKFPRSFQAAMKRLRHAGVTMALTSSGVVIRGLPDGGLSFLLPDCRKRVSRLYIFR